MHSLYEEASQRGGCFLSEDWRGGCVLLGKVRWQTKMELFVVTRDVAENGWTMVKYRELIISKLIDGPRFHIISLSITPIYLIKYTNQNKLH